MIGNIEITKKILPFLIEKCKNKIFLEAGANDGLRFSNTLILEKDYGWNGTLVEPNTKHFKNCLKNRPKCEVINKALVSSTYQDKTIKGSFGEFSKDDGLVGGVRFDYWIKKNELEHHLPHIVDVEVITLSEIIKNSNFDCPSFISLDIEGYELEALKGLDFKIYRPDVLLIEIFEWDILEIYNQHVSYLDNFGYKLEEGFSDNNNYLFIKK